MSLFAKPTKPVYMKINTYGPTGSGKTFTSGLFAIGMAKALNSKKPVALYDTESGSDFLIPMFQKAGIELVVIKSRSFAKLVEATREAEKMASVFLIDSISHIWEDLIEAYKIKKGRKYIQINEWGEIKAYWNTFTKAYINANINIIICGRSQDITENYREDSGEKGFEKIGERMKAEKHLGHESSVLIRLDSKQDLKNKKVTHIAFIEKDRTNTMTGALIEEPTFESILPIWNSYDHKGVAVGIDDDTSVKHIEDPDYNIEDRKRRRAIAIEEIQNTLVRYFPSTAVKDKQAKMSLLRDIYGTDNWTKITEDVQNVKLEDLEAGLSKLEAAAKIAAGVGSVEAKPMMEAAVVTARPKKGGK